MIGHFRVSVNDLKVRGQNLRNILTPQFLISEEYKLFK